MSATQALTRQNGLSSHHSRTSTPVNSKGTKKTKKGLNTDNVLGHHYEKRKDAALSKTQFQTKKFRTYNSAWTPMVHKPSNKQIFEERTELVSHWFGVWTDLQRKRFLDAILRQCARSQLYFMQNWFQERVPLRHLDFTTCLPRFLSLYVLSFLDPRSLCRASEVCWRWKFMAEQDELWIPKCTKLGWYLPYSPSSNEYGAWKRHYVACLMTLDMVGPSTDAALYGRIGDGTEVRKPKKKNTLLRSNKLQKETSDLVIATRPPWVNTDKKPRDLEMAAKALIDGRNPNDPKLDRSQLTVHNKFGQVKSQLVTKSLPSSLNTYSEFGLESSRRRAGHRVLTGEEDFDLSQETLRKMNLSRSIELQNLEEKRLEEIAGTSWEPPAKRIMPKRPNLSGGGGDYPVPWSSRDKRSMALNYPNHVNPRIIFISSRVPAADLLVDAVLFGVIPIVYEYEGTTLDSLMSRLDVILEGRHASSIGIFCHQDEPSEMRLVHGYTADLDDLDNPDVLEFFEYVASHTLPPSRGGRVDLFVPLGSNEYGNELMAQLQIVTGMQFNAPTGIIGNYNHINSEWLLNPDGATPPSLYFAQSKLNVWANTADIAQDAVNVTRTNLQCYFEQKHRDLVSQVAGQAVFDAMGQTDIQGLNEVTSTLVEGLISLGKQKNVKPVEYLGKFLLEKCGMTVMDATAKSSSTGTQKTVSGVASTPRKPSFQYSEDFDEDDPYLDATIEEDIEEDIEEEMEDDVLSYGEKKDEPKRYKEKKQEQNEMKMNKSSGSSNVSGHLQFPAATMSMTPRYTRTPRTTAKVPMRMSTEEFAIQPDKRMVTAREIHASEVEYKRTLEILRDVFILPLRAALNSNRAIIGAASMQTIFTYPMQILEACQALEKDLRGRVNEWSSQQCVGDVFIKFCGKLKIYTNYCNNYPVILSSIERCMEQSPGFRAFLKRHNRSPNTKMLTIQEILLYPTRRILEYTKLLSLFETHTPADHADRADLAQAIAMLKDLSEFIAESKMRVEHEKELVRLQKTILNCPCLLESNRYLIRHEDMAHLKPPSDEVTPELRRYQHIEMLGLFLFNDALLITRRTTKHFPYERSMEHTYTSEASLALTTLKVEEIADSKFVKNAFKMMTSRKCWICAADSFDAKYNWITVLESAVRAAVQLK